MKLYNEKYDVFFGENGLTSTSANFIANKAKELYDMPQRILGNIKFTDYSICVPGTGQQAYEVKEGMTLDQLDKSINAIDSIGELKALISWLREAIKARENMLAEIQKVSWAFIVANLGYDAPEQPRRIQPMTQDEALATLSIKERCRYYTLEAQCANLGKIIHPDGPLSNALKNVKSKILNPISTRGEGRDLTITKYSASIDPAEVEKRMMVLQEKHRSYQAELNGIKHKLEVMVQEDTAKKQSEFTNAYSEWTKEINRLEQVAEEARLKELEIARGLKIVIPDALRKAYDIVKAAGAEA